MQALLRTIADRVTVEMSAAAQGQEQEDNVGCLLERESIPVARGRGFPLKTAALALGECKLR